MLTPLRIVVLVGSLALAASPLHAARRWDLSVADATYRAGTYGSMRLDAGGEPHISSWPSGGLRHTWHDAGGWHGEMVPYPPAPAPGAASAGAVGPEATGLLTWLVSSIAIDPEGRPHIAWTYTNDTGCCGPVESPIRFSTRADTGWVSEDVSPETGDACSLDIDPGGRPFIAYEASGGVHCLMRDGGNWVLSVVAATGWSPCLRVDPAGVAHVAYETSSGGEYATPAGGSWVSEPTPAGDAPSLAFTADGEPRIAGLGAGSSVSYAERHQGTWAVIVPDSLAGPATDVSLALSPIGEPRIAYRNLGPYRPWFLERDSGAWTDGPIDPLHDGYYPQAGVDAAGRVLVEYEDPLVGGIRWAQSSWPTLVPPRAAPRAFALTAISPAAVGAPLRLRVALPRSATVGIELYDVVGRRLARRAPVRLEVGEQAITWPAALSRPGFYWVRARDDAGEFAFAHVVALR